MAPSVLISIPHQGMVAAGLVHFIAATIGRGNIYGIVTPEKKPFAVARNHQAKLFLDTPATHCLFIDSDTIPPPGTVDRLLGYDQAIVGLPVPAAGRGGTAWPVALLDTGCDDEHGTRRHAVAYEAITRGGLIDVDGMGLACCLIRRDVFEALSPPWFVDQLTPEGGLHLEADLWFCRRAREAGFQPRMSCEGGLISPICGHMKLRDVSDSLRAWGDLDGELHEATIAEHREVAARRRMDRAAPLASTA